MKIERREFLKYVGTGTVATTLPVGPSFLQGQNPPQAQRLHQDYQSNTRGLEYYFLGNGLIMAAIQTSTSPEAGTHCGLLVMSPDHFGRKMSTFLYHPERGLQNSRLVCVLDRQSYVPVPGSSTIQWEYPNDIPTVAIVWQAGDCRVEEKVFCPINEPALIREIKITNTGLKSIEASAVMQLYPNLMFFDEYEVDRKNLVLTAAGYRKMQLFSPNASAVGDRHMTLSFGEIAPGKEVTAVITLTLNYPREKFERKGITRMKQETAEYWRRRAHLETGHDGLNHLFNSSKTSLRAVVARSGKVDGGVWQYNLEWVRDQAIQSVGCVMSGHVDAAQAILRRILTRSIGNEGQTVEASRHRPPETMELDQNGALLFGLWSYWVWTGDDSLMKNYWRKIQKVANYVLQPVFRDPKIGLVKNSRELWERDPNFGVKEGYELAYQSFNIIGLHMASEMAVSQGDQASAQRWTSASELMKESFLHHPQFSLVEDGRFVKRRLVSGEVQRTFEPPRREAMPAGMPLNVESISYCDPDAGNVLPIAFEIIDAKSTISLKTLESMEHLWNQRWDTGGYARYDVSSEPDSPGPWPFATMFIARAYHEAGNDEKVWRALNWLLEVQGGKSGAWFEYYGDRPTPPLPPVGIVVWTWAEIVIFFIHHVLGVRPSPRKILIRPKLLSGIDRVKSTLFVHRHEVALDVQRDPAGQWARVNGKRMPLKDQTLELPFPQRNTTVEIHV
ncbi:MAG: hypothetical protein HY562_04060 [Ignavibacteriales bacterium]|nr:hypothetical protein [Ignavibacteriales bacterium]